ncbi:DEAD/DEAH box helicase [Paenibacillus sp. 1P07SE]|uniref:DEAD/DEAH box helicase n=1 Tax=Paenibacillus sp. 1P07SE TaxID=3132209 RepID=UPI0039A772CC
MNENDSKNPIKKMRDFQSKFAGDKLVPHFAKLYSQYTRLSYNQSGLSGWNGTQEFSNRLHDAIKLIDIGLFDKKQDGNQWRGTLRRAGEILEWLSHPELNIDNLPIKFLSAAAYQLAGYPALAVGLLNNAKYDSDDSDILRSLLTANFPQLQLFLQEFWNDELDEKAHSEYEELVIRELIRSIGILNMYMRWGDESRVEIAQQKLMSISKLQTYHEDPLSWLLTKLCAEIFQEYFKKSLRLHVNDIKLQLTPDGETALEKYLRNSFLAKKSLVWTSQIKGIEQLASNKSFALCTPTGTGKTTVAELAIIMGLFKSIEMNEDSEWIIEFLGESFPAAIAIYLVPSRALATEVEMKLNAIFDNTGNTPVKVTGLYGGIDWGPTDAWLTSNERTVLICTYEKAEALIRFLGPLFLSRVSLVVIDEAHAIQFDGKHETLVSADNRSLRLETLCNRLLMHLDEHKSRVVALSAVAAEGSNTLAQWVSGDNNTQAETVPYRNTRQLIGRLEWSKSGEYKIYYDVMNGTGLKFQEGHEGENVPFIPKPFTPFPISFSKLIKEFTKAGPSKKLRPYLVWAAIQIAKKDGLGFQNSVLISVTQSISGYAKDFLYILEKTFKNIQVPDYFSEPANGSDGQLWQKCIRSCEDYFGIDSVEYRLLRRGVVVHYGNMPGLTARLLVQVINMKIIPIVLATSTLSEGINLPFETILIPTLVRNQELLTVREFSNLVGRAGRPGVATEGRALIMLEDIPTSWSDKQPNEHYKTLISQILNTAAATDTIKSPLSELLRELEGKWNIAFNSNDKSQFLKWLEVTIPLNDEENISLSLSAEELLDTLDGILISALVELEQIDEKKFSPDTLEDELRSIWRKSYAYFAASEKSHLENTFIKRGVSIPNNIYTDSTERRKIYRTSLSPRFANELISKMPEIISHLSMGSSYHNWNTDEKLEYISKTARKIFSLKKFQVKSSIGRGKNTKEMHDILRWWLVPSQVVVKPDPTQLSTWVKYINYAFTYQFNWGIGTVISLILDEAHDGRVIPTSLESWNDTGLPWIVFWLKEMITWGVIDPVAAYLLARGICDTRRVALELANEYYEFANEISSDVYDAIVIRDWVLSHHSKLKEDDTVVTEDIPVHLIRDFQDHSITDWRVYPVRREDKIIWIDPAGYEFAYSFTEPLEIVDINQIDFTLNYKDQIVKVRRYMA